MIARLAPGVASHRAAVSPQELEALGVDLKRDFPGSSIEDFKRYPVLSEGGWYLVVKHLPTLQSIDRTPWRLLGPITLTSDGLIID
jgi:hypothetical protein